MKDLIEQAESLRTAIKARQKEIDNPALVMSILNELEFFIDNVEGDGE